ncbi:precorrin-8X methylmutase, partial [Salmonella enterica subsp. enterica serovar Stanley]|nr:precorrin-8X methylmutase [Salmonella enterica subsp. enterica serovar Stanley]
AEESKDALTQSNLPAIAALGRKGGSNVAAAIVNAMLYHMQGAR